jgi:uncharacterized protein (TIGR00290 family)
MKTLLAWSSGKDSAFALQALRSLPEVEVVGLLTTVNETFARVPMHAVRRELVEAQAAALELPLTVAAIPHPCPNATYEEVMARTTTAARAAGIEAIAFGDLALEEVRRYREQMMSGTGLTPLFPLWGRSTGELAREMIAADLRAVVTCVDPRALPAELAGRPFDEAFLGALPPGVDPCGESGEFHTFVWGGPMFEHPIPIAVGQTVTRDGFVFADVLPR